VHPPAHPARITPPPSPQEAAAIAAAIESFVRDTARPPAPAAMTGGGWLRAARTEAVERDAHAPPGAAERQPWRGGAGTSAH